MRSAGFLGLDRAARVFYARGACTHQRMLVIAHELLLLVTCQLSAVGVELGAGLCVEVAWVWLSLQVVSLKGRVGGGGEESRRSPREREECSEHPHHGEAQKGPLLRSVVKFSELFQACRFG